VEAAVVGTLTEATLGGLLTEAATAQMINTYRSELRQRSERPLVAAFHQALQACAAQELLASLQDRWQEHTDATAGHRPTCLRRTASSVNCRSRKTHTLQRFP